MTIIHFLITFVVGYYNEDFHIPTNIINPCKCNSYSICGLCHNKVRDVLSWVFCLVNFMFYFEK